MTFLGGLILVLFIGVNVFVFHAHQNNRIVHNGKPVRGLVAYFYGLFLAFIGFGFLTAVIGAVVSFVIVITSPIWTWFV